MSSRVRLRRYLTRATRGLWGQRRALVSSELEGHIRVRMNDLRLLGLSEEKALSRTLDELGAPALVSRGMARLYTVPRLTPLLFAGLLFASAISLSQGSVAEMDVLRVGVLPPCDSSALTLQIVEVPNGLRLDTDRCAVDMGQSWLGLGSLRGLVVAAGGSWRELPDEVEIRFSGGDLVRIRLPTDVPAAYRQGQADRAVARDWPPSAQSSSTDGVTAPAAGAPAVEPVAISLDGESHLSTRAFVQALAEQSGLVVRLEPATDGGAPQLHVGDTSLVLTGLPPEAVHGVLARALTHRLFEEPTIERVAWDLERGARAPEQYRFSLTAPAGSVGALYAVAYRTVPGTVRLSLVTPHPSGELRVRLPWAEPTWISDAADLGMERAALLVHLTGVVSDPARLYEPFEPTAATLR